MSDETPPDLMPPLDTERVRALVARVREALPALLGIYAFGSRATGHARDDSDLDLAVLVGGYVPPEQLWGLASELAELAGVEVDLVDLRAATSVMAHQVLTYGRRLWGRDPEAGVYEAFVLTDKLRFDEARAGLLADIAARGSVYGR